MNGFRHDDIALKCGCGRVVKFTLRVPERRAKFNCVVLCDGSLYDGHVPYYAVFKDREIQDYALVDKWGSGVSCDTYALYHLDEELSALVKVSEALDTTLAQAAHDLAKVTVYRRLTFKRGEDFDSVQAGIEFSAPKSSTIQEMKRELESLRRVLEDEKRDTIAGTKPTPMQKPETPDPYADSLQWRQSKNDANLAMIRVTEKLPPPGRELYQKLRTAEKRTLRIGEACYKLWVTGDGAEFLQRWSKSQGGS